MGWKASADGRAKIQAMLQQKGWSAYSVSFLEQASRAIDPNYNLKGSAIYAAGVSETTAKRFVYATQPIRPKPFQAFCEALNLSWQEILEDAPRQSPYDWNLAPLDSNFCGRTTELERLQNWLSNRCRLILVHGLSGIGKTALVAKLAQQSQSQFEGLAWQPFSSNESIEMLLANLLDRLSSERTIQSKNSHQLVTNLFAELSQRRILVILDEQNHHQKTNDFEERYRSLLLKLGEHQHQSCFIVTTRVKPLDFTGIASTSTNVMQLQGINTETTCQLLQTKNLSVDQQLAAKLTQRYGGNPLALKLAASVISSLFNGNVERFLSDTVFVPETLEKILNRQLQTLNSIDRTSLQSLAELAEPVSREELQEHLQNKSANVTSAQFIRSLSNLERQSLIEKVSEADQVLYALQPIVSKVVQQLGTPQ